MTDFQKLLIIDMSNAKPYNEVIKRRSRIAHDKRKNFKMRNDKFIRSGFTEEEAYWACKNGLSPKNKQVSLIMDHRLNQVKWRMKDYNMTWDDAVQESAKDLENKLDKKNEFNLFKEVSP